jgi:hypothetical protein
MIKFRQKNYTIQEGHYTGPKDVDKVPGALELVGKGTIGGAVLGGLIGKVATDKTIDGAITGGKWGALSGILLKFFLNYLHNPMSTIKYQEVDRNIRRAFGVYRISGVTVGDSVDKRASIDEKFSFNDRNVTDYKLNFAVADNKVTMYTFGITPEELKKIDHSLDYYCKKYSGMNYTAEMINQRVNAYSVNIVFTNYQVISNFIMELSNVLQTKINLLDSKALVDGRIKDKVEKTDEEIEEKNFSVAEINKYDLAKILGTSGMMTNAFHKIVSPKSSFNFGSFIMHAILLALKKISNDELVKSGAPAPKENFGNTYLESELKKLHYIEGFNYTVSDKDAKDNISLMGGRFIITTPKGSDSQKEIDKKVWQGLKSKIFRNEIGKSVVYVYNMSSKQEFRLVLNKLMSTKITFNIFE